MNNILLIGGNSKLGISIRNRNIFCGTYVSRNPDSFHNSIFKHSYNQLTAADFSGYQQVLNLIGSNVPDTETLQAVNVDLVHHLAQEARKAGVKSFVNVSSFSVFGSTQEIGLNTQPSPESAYGQAKLQAELVLAKMSDANFGVTNVRLPMLYGAHGSKLHTLLNIWAKIRYLPVPNLTAKRSMLHYDLAADALLGLNITSGTRTVAFADPEPLQFARVGRVMSDCAGYRVSPLIVGKYLLAPLKWVMPGTYQSLYSSCYLTAPANEIEGTALESRLYQDIHEMAASLYA
jgi:UDP-glucose 4-epimerase